MTTNSKTFQTGDRVEGGEYGTEDYDTGRVVSVNGDKVTVWWDSEGSTTQTADSLRPEVTEEERERAAYEDHGCGCHDGHCACSDQTHCHCEPGRCPCKDGCEC